MTPVATSTMREHEAPAAAGCGTSCARGRPRSCRSVRCPARGQTSDQCRHRPPCPTAADTKFCTVRPDHLGEVAQRALAGVALPVGVGDEADRGVERQRAACTFAMSVGLNGSPLWIRWITYEQDEADDAEREQRQRVDVPALLALGVDPAEPVDQPLDRTEDPVEPRRTAVVDAGDVAAEERRGHPEERRSGRSIAPSLRTSSEPLGEEQRGDQVDGQQHSEDEPGDVLARHGSTSAGSASGVRSVVEVELVVGTDDPVAAPDERDARCEEPDHRHDHPHVCHAPVVPLGRGHEKGLDAFLTRAPRTLTPCGCRSHLGRRTTET